MQSIAVFKFIVRNIDHLPKFATVVALTENRKGVALRNENYFHQLMTIYGEDAYLYLAKVNLPKRLAQFKEQLLQMQRIIRNFHPIKKVA